MDIFDILREAKNPSKSNTKTIKISTDDSYDYTSDVPNEESENNQTGQSVNIDTTKNNDSTDYSAEVEEVEPDDNPNTDSEETDTNTTDTDESTDYTDNIDSDDATDDTGNEEGSDDPGESTDYTAGVDDDTDSSDATYDDTEASGDQNNQSPEDMLMHKQNVELLNTIIDLYYSITGTCAKLDAITHSHIMANKINIQVKKNLSSLSEYMYRFIVYEFNNNTYVKNLYIYNYIIESYKINIKMLSKVNEFK